MSFFIPLLISAIAGLSTVLGSFVIFIKWPREKINQFITFSLSFSLSIMIGLSVTELIPEASYKILSHYKLGLGIICSLSALLLGILAIYFIHKRIEQSSRNSDLYQVGLLSMFALMLHNFPEGILTFLSSVQNITLGLKISLAILLHNIPEGISIAVPIYYGTGSKKEAIKNTFLSGVAEPIGAFLAFLFLRNYITDTLIGFILIFVAGIMITLSIHDLLPKALYYHENKWLILGFVIGIIFIIFNTYFM